MTPTDIGLFAALTLYTILLTLPTRKYWRITLALLAAVCGTASLLGGEWEVLPGLVLSLISLAAVLGGARLAHARRTGSGVTASLTALCALPFWFFPIFQLPPPGGAYAVGTTSLEMTDTTRTGLLGRPKGEPRRLPVRIWYPAAPGSQGPRAIYTGWRQALSLGHNFGEAWFYYAQLAAVRPHALRDIPIAQGPWPVVLFNHGFWSYPEQNTALGERLASHGYVVVSIGHPGDSVAFRLSDGTLLRPWQDGMQDSPSRRALEQGIAAFMGGRTEEARFAGLAQFAAASAGHRIGVSARAWRDDNLFVWSALTQGREPAIAAIRAQMDFTRASLAGMSFGGSVAPSACAEIASCKAAINLDGESFDFSQYNADFGRPLLIVLTGQPFASSQYPDPSTNPTDYAYERWATAGEAPDIYRLRVASLRHLGLTDLLLSARPPFKAHRYGTIDAERGVALINDATLEFLDRYVKGVPSNFPKFLLDTYPEVSPHDASHVRRAWLAQNGALGHD